MNHTFYRIGPHVLELVNHSSLNLERLLPSFTPFLLNTITNTKTKPLFTCMLVHQMDEPDAICEFLRFEWKGANVVIFSCTDGYLVHLFPLRGKEVKRMVISITTRTVFVELSDQEEETVNAFVLNNFLMMSYAFIGAYEGTLQIHASVICHAGKGYLFLGKSGTGKSTHSSLWLKHISDSELLNDDNPIVHYTSDSDSVMVYGSPWSGKTPCYRQKQVPISAFVRLEQSPENQIIREGVGRAFASLLPCCSCLKQDSTIYNAIMDAIARVVTKVPVYKLQCRPDREAAELCYKTVCGE